MEQAFTDLFILLRENIIFPIATALNNVSWTRQLITTLNIWLNSVFNFFRETDVQTTIQFLSIDFISQCIGIFILIWFICLLVKIFKLSFQTLKKVYLSIVEVGPIEKGSSKTWRRQWKRKK